MSLARERLETARVARLATVRPDGSPHLVPFVFAVEDDRVYSAVDDKPKRSPELQRLANIAREPRVCVLADHYEEDWSGLWWVRADGRAVALPEGDDQEEREHALDLLAERYVAYRERRPSGAVVRIDVDRWTTWPEDERAR
ncbi:MAG: TIGR03668 family PPOX class F420-dependent oxidoreductase [Actinomycetota bacterium]